MHESIYCSVATRLITLDDLNAILKTARQYNTKHNITGMLVYYGKTREFVQWLEGNKEDLQALCNDRIAPSKSCAKAQ